VIDSDLLSVVSTFATNVMASSGAWPGLAGPDGVAPVGHLGQPVATYRQLKRGSRTP
jgi:hypothetical protein